MTYWVKLENWEPELHGVISGENFDQGLWFLESFDVGVTCMQTGHSKMIGLSEPQLHAWNQPGHVRATQ